ncbi:MAG: DUF1292 domain-containing protein [Ruminococcus sp.]|jgi:hypothetical protein|nr:DUF1292 domain-containing protein [Ruminococcus sp.]
MDEFMADLYTLVDEDNVETKFELVDVMEYEGERYYAMTPYFEDDSEALEADAEIIILKSEVDGDEEILITVDDDVLYEKIGNMFLERINAEFEDED